MGSIKEDAHRYRCRCVEKLLALFEGDNGRPARTVLELEQWLGSARGKAATAYDRTPDGKIIPDPAS
jgi:hypothetical protein